MISIDQGELVLLVLLDLSLAFDTIDYNVLFSRFNLSGKILELNGFDSI